MTKLRVHNFAISLNGCGPTPIKAQAIRSARPFLWPAANRGE